MTFLGVQLGHVDDILATAESFVDLVPVRDVRLAGDFAFGPFRIIPRGYQPTRRIVR
jgi:hypothetical protein